MLAEILTMILLSMAPVSEVRGGIPYGFLATQLTWPSVLIICVIANIIAGLLVFLLLDKAIKLANKIKFISKIYKKYIARSQKKIHEAVEKWGVWGIAIFIGIPLPMTGAWTAAVGANAIGISFKKFAIATIIGVLIAGVIVTAVMLTGSEVFSLFTAK